MSNLPWGLLLGQKAFRKNYHRKKMTAVFIAGSSITIDSNCNKTSPKASLLKYRFNHQHAEFNVLKNIKDGSKGTLYIYRETFDGKLGLAKPCPQCLAYIKSKNIRKIVYTTPEGYAKEKLIY